MSIALSERGLGMCGSLVIIAGTGMHMPGSQDGMKSRPVSTRYGWLPGTRIGMTGMFIRKAGGGRVVVLARGYLRHRDQLRRETPLANSATSSRHGHEVNGHENGERSGDRDADLQR